MAWPPSSDPVAPVPEPVGTAPIRSYVAAVLITVVAILSQYFLPQLVPTLDPLYRSVISGYLIVYGIPIVAFATLVGFGPLRRWRSDLRRSALPALGWYGALSGVSLIVLVGLLLLYEALDPSALTLLTRPNPVLTDAESDPWLWIGLSFLIGAVEETIFRGWIFGYWVHRRSPSPWFHAIWTSGLFAGLHLYYGTTYLEAAPLIYPELFFLGLAFALAVRSSRGNLVWVALLHGATDAISFSAILDPNVAAALHYALIGIGAIVALYLYFGNRPIPPAAYAISPPFAGNPQAAPGYFGGPRPAVPLIPPPPPPPPPPSMSAPP